MSNNTKTGGPAFPCPVGHIECAHPEGMSLRDWYAGQALSGVLASRDREYSFADFAADAFGYADAMIAEKIERDTR